VKLQRHLWPFIFFSCLAFFVFTRFYLLPQTLYFWGDIGRDHEVLIEMVQNMRPILLGPSNSQLPFNQSAWYFYLNLPVFFLSGFSAYTTAITGVLLTLGAFIFSGWLEKTYSKHTHKLAPLCTFILLLTLEPTFLTQQRSTWNPAFAVPFLVTATTIVWHVLQKVKLPNWLLIVLALSLSFSIGMTYAVIPIVAVYFAFVLWKLPKPQKWRFILWMFMALGVVFLPHLLFEARHNFLLTTQLLQHESSVLAQPLLQKLQTGVANIFGFSQMNIGQGRNIALISILILIGIARTSKKYKRWLTLLLVALGVSFLTSCLAVSEFNSHYSLGLSVMLFFIIAQLPAIWRLGTSMLLIFFWLPTLSTPFTQRPHRTVADLESCAALVCAQNPEPMYVTAQAWHDFHSGYDYSFFMNKHGCYTRDIGSNPSFSNKLAVVVDRSGFDPETTSFYELTLFGEKKSVTKYQCKDDLSVEVFVN
jgi:hypothetical protein